MFTTKNFKYRDILIFVLLGILGYKLIDNYEFLFNIIRKFIGIISPLIYSVICAYVLNPVVSFFEDKLKIKKVLAITITYLIIIGLIIVILFFTIPSTIDSILKISLEIPTYVESVKQWINQIIENDRIKGLLIQAGLLTKLEELSTQMGSLTIVLLENVVMYLLSFTSNLLNIILGFLISIYVLADKTKFVRNVRIVTFMILKEKRGIQFINFVRTYNKMIGTYIGIKAIDSTIVGLIALVGLFIAGAPYAPLVALVAGVTNMIPYFGPLTGIIFGTVVAIFVSPMKALMVLILLLCIQQFDEWYLNPKLIGDKVGVSPFGIILGVIIGGGVLGPLGMLLASPTIGTLNIYYEKIFRRFKENNPKLVRKENLDGLNKEL